MCGSIWRGMNRVQQENLGNEAGGREALMGENQLGLLHIYCGDGKGKTTAALGQAVRAAGRGWRVGIARFLKTEDSGEVPVLKQIPGIQLLPCTQSFGFTFRMSEKEREKASQYYQAYFDLAVSRWGLSESAFGSPSAPGSSTDFPRAFRREKEDGLFAEPVDVVVLDEILGTCQSGLFPREKLERFLENRRKNLEVILTGRNAWESLLEMADYVTEMKMVKHPYTRGVAARKGIEW